MNIAAIFIAFVILIGYSIASCDRRQEEGTFRVTASKQYPEWIAKNAEKIEANLGEEK